MSTFEIVYMVYGTLLGLGVALGLGLFVYASGVSGKEGGSDAS